MHDKKAFLKHLENLSNMGKKSVTVDIDFLLDLLKQPMPRSDNVPPKPQMPPNRIFMEIDGGSF
jgi:hypothetical protein